MSAAQQYTLKVVIDDSKIKELERRLAQIMGMKPASSGGGASAGGMFGPAFAKNIMSLAKIATGIGMLVVFGKKMLDLAIKSSPIAQSSFKLLQTSINFILRPIGDVIGFVVRPFALMMLKWAIPFYKNWANSTTFQKFARGDIIGALMEALGLTTEVTQTPATNWGEALKQAEAKLFTDWQGFVNELGLELATLGVTIQDAFSKLGAKFEPAIKYVAGIAQTIISKVRGFFVDVHKSLKLTELTKMWEGVTNWFNSMRLSVSEILDGGLKAFVAFFGDIVNSVSDNLYGYWKIFTDFFLNISTSIQTTVSSAWNSLTKFINDLVNFFKTLPQKIWNAIIEGIGKSVFGGGGGSTTNNTYNIGSINNAPGQKPGLSSNIRKLPTDDNPGAPWLTAQNKGQ